MTKANIGTLMADESLKYTAGKTIERRIKAKESKTRRWNGHVSRMNEGFQRRF
jgi:hypothetical protein